MSDTPEYSQGICQDGAAILKDGVPMTIEEILGELRAQQGSVPEYLVAGDRLCHELESWMATEHDRESQCAVFAWKRLRRQATTPQPAQQGTAPEDRETTLKHMEQIIRQAGRDSKSGPVGVVSDYSSALYEAGYRRAAQQGSVPEGWLGYIKDAERHLTNWMQLKDCDCEYGHTCGYTEVHRTAEALRDLLSATPHPEGDGLGVEHQCVCGHRWWSGELYSACPACNPNPQKEQEQK